MSSVRFTVTKADDGNAQETSVDPPDPVSATNPDIPHHVLVDDEGRFAITEYYITHKSCNILLWLRQRLQLRSDTVMHVYAFVLPNLINAKNGLESLPGCIDFWYIRVQ